MRSWLMPLVLTALLLGNAHVADAQQSPSADQERAVRIEARFVDVARYREAGRFDACLDSLSDIITLANVRDRSGQKNDAALARAEKEVVWLRSMIAGQAASQVRLVQGLHGEIDATANAFLPMATMVATWQQPDRGTMLASVSTGIEKAQAFLLQQGFANDRVTALVGLKRNRERATQLADQVCRARSRDALGNAIDAIAAESRQADDVIQEVERWGDARFGRPPDSPVSTQNLASLGEGLRGLETYSATLDPMIAEYEKTRAQRRRELEGALATLRTQVERLDSEQQRLELLLRDYRRCGELGQLGEDHSFEWQRAAPRTGVAEARGRIADLEKTLAGLQQWDGTGARSAVGRTQADIARLQVPWSEVNRIVAETDAAVPFAKTDAYEVQRARDRADECLRTIGSRAAAPAAAASAPRPESPAAAAAPIAAAAQDPTTDAAGTSLVRPAQSVAPAAAAVAAPPVSAVTPPPVNPNVAGGLKIQGPTTRIGVGQRVQFVATDHGNRPYTKVTWSSFDDELLSLDAQGWATGLKPGALQIQALLEDERVATLSVEVVERPGAALAPVPPVVPATPGPADQAAGFHVGATQAEPASEPENTAAPEQMSAPVTPATDTHRGGASLLGVETPAAPAAAGAPSGAGFAVGATTVGRDSTQPPPQAGGGQPGGGGSGGGSPPRGSQPPGPPQTRAVAGQPAAYHIFATGSRLGWASGLGQYSIGPADGSIIEHLQVAGDHVLWANRESYPPVKAWPNWTANRAEMRSWADGLVRDPRNETRRQISISANSRAATLADELRYQTMGTVEHVATCDAAYMSLGYELGYAQQVLGIADEAARNGDAALAQQAQRDGMSHLQNSLRILAEYERTGHLTGRCADLRDVRTRLDAIWRAQSGELSGQSSATTAAWTLALERIVALRGGQPGAVVQSPPPTPAARPAGGQTQTLGQGLDPGELEGTWFECGKEWLGSDEGRPDSPPRSAGVLRCVREGQRHSASGLKEGGLMVRFTRNGTQYVGREAGDSSKPWSVRDAFSGFAFGYQPAAEVFRLTRTVSGTYEGEVFDCPGCIPGDRNEGKWVSTRMVVEGDVAREYYYAHGGSTGIKVYWVRASPLQQAPSSERPAP